jgi:hypothetical protein
MDSIREWCVVKVTDDTCPEVDLEALGSDDGCLSGLLAAEMGAIVSRDEESMGSLRNAARAVIRQYDGCDLPDLNDEDLQAIARDVGYDILMKLMVDSGEDSQ